MQAADDGHPDVVRLLLDHGANIQHANNVSTGTGAGVHVLTRFVGCPLASSTGGRR